MQRIVDDSEKKKQIVSLKKVSEVMYEFKEGESQSDKTDTSVTN